MAQALPLPAIAAFRRKGRHKLIQVVALFRQCCNIAPGMAGCHQQTEEGKMNQIIWIVGLVVIVLFVLGYFGLR
ncbi:MAG: hypothetical protein JJT95_19460 [Pararhodobacter sp.]|nr:hypothetical protein [Pararhodobacter sp.]